MELMLHIGSIRNELIKSIGRQSLRILAPLVSMSIRRRLKRHAQEQTRLRSLYSIRSETPITSWGTNVQTDLDRVSARQSSVRYAFTSGSTSKPKRIPYTPKRLRDIRRASFEAVVQTTQAYNIKEPTLFVLAGMGKDDSLSSLLLEGNTGTSFLDGLVMPSRYLWHPSLRPLIENYGTTAVRLCLLVLSNPGILYSTNPSTLALFLKELEQHWMDSSKLLQDLAINPSVIPPAVRAVFQKLVAKGWEKRVRLVAAAPSLPNFQDIVPALRCYCCWDGGYVTPFLHMIREYLRPDQYVHVPMYSMSTECLQTQTFFVENNPHYFPFAPGVLYEFLPDNARDDPSCLVSAQNLEEGRCYSMIVSDSYGLSRYQTDDVFLCVGRIGNNPDLRFLRRRGLAYSFSGEKITGNQVEAAFLELKKACPTLNESGIQMTVIPALSDINVQEGLPHYRLVLTYATLLPPAVSIAQVSADFDHLLGVQNREFLAKRESGRLGPIQTVFVGYDRFAQMLNRDDNPNNRGWDTQFKLVPLFIKRWDKLGLPSLETL